MAFALRTVARQAVRCSTLRVAAPLLSRPMTGAFPAAPVGARSISAAAGKVAKQLSAELKHEEEQYEQAKEIKDFLKSTPFKFVQEEGDVNMALTREMGDRTVRIEWQLTSPFDPEADDEQGQADMQDATEVSITVENKAGAGLTLFCSTQTGEDHRYVIGMVKTFASAEEKESVSAYNGPEFEDLDDKLQETFDEYLAELGMSSEVCDFIDATALEKEQREYIRWLKISKAFLEG